MENELAVLRELSPVALGRPLSWEESALFTKYLKILVKWQRSQRLVGSAEPQWIERELLAAALIFERFVPWGARSLLDVGSGPGLPGIPLKIVRRDLEVVLLESRAKRVSFLRAVVRELGLAGLTVVGKRAQVATDLFGRFDVVTVRCALTPEAVAPLGRRFLSPTGRLLISGPPHPTPRPDIQWETVTVPGIGTRHVGVLIQPAPA